MLARIGSNCPFTPAELPSTPEIHMPRVSVLSCFLLALLLIPTGAAHAAGSMVDVTVVGGYRLAGSWGQIQNNNDNLSEKIQIQGGAQWGIMVDMAMDRRWWIGLSFDTSTTPLQLTRNGDTQPLEDGDIRTGYLHFNLMYTYPKGKWEPYLMGGLGIINLNPTESDFNGKFRGSWQFAGGGRYFFAERFGVRAQARIRSSYTPNASQLFCELGFCGQPISSSWMWQGDGLLGLVIRF